MVRNPSKLIILSDGTKARRATFLVPRNKECPILRAEVDTFRDYHGKIKGVKFYVNDTSELIGSGYIELDKEFMSRHGYLGWLEVTTKWRGLGCGTSLFRFMEKQGATWSKSDVFMGQLLMIRAGWVNSDKTWYKQ